jgi:hypothetical protein
MPKGYHTISTLDPNQQGLYNQYAGSFSGITPQIAEYLQQLLSGSPEATKAFSDPYMRQFNEEIVPGIAERFAGSGALSSSGFQNSLGQAGAGLAERLASLRENLRMGAANTGLGGVQNLLGMNTQALVPKQQSGWQSFLGGLAPGLGSALGAGIGGLATGGIGPLMSLLGGLFGGNKQGSGNLNFLG